VGTYPSYLSFLLQPKLRWQALQLKAGKPSVESRDWKNPVILEGGRVFFAVFLGRKDFKRKKRPTRCVGEI